MKTPPRSRRYSLGILLAAIAIPALVAAQPPGGFPGGAQGRGGPGGSMQQEREIVAQFDKNGDKRLDADERQAARAWLAMQPMAGPGGGRGPGGPGGPGGRGGRGGGRGSASGTPGARIAPADVRSYPSDTQLYDVGALRTIFLQFENADWERELADFNNTDVEVPATVVVDGKTYKDVGVHFRGQSSYFSVPEGLKRSLNLSFDFVDGKQTLGGYQTLNLLNGNNDPTFVRTVLYSHIANQFLPAPKTNYVRVVINGESWGIYVSAQQYNKDFLRDFYATTDGARWKVPGSPGARAGLEFLGNDATPYKRLYEIKSKDDPKRWADLINLTRVLNETPAAQLEQALEPIFDVDGALKFLALEVAMVNSDGYWTRASDYSIYQDPKGRFHIIPHDMNEGLGGEGAGRGGPGGPPGGFGPDMGRGGFPPPPGGMRGGPMRGGRGGPGGGGVELDPLVGLDDPAKPLRSKLLAVPALRQRYLGYVREIADRWLDWKTVQPLVQQYQALIAKDVEADTRKLYDVEGFRTGISESESSLKTFLERRRAFLLKRVGEL